MAYNPFDIFRRNQRAIFAVVTVFIMFTFVLSSGLSGGADFFDWFPAWLGSSKRGESLATLDGSKVHARDVDQLKYHRTLASKFMQYAGFEAVQGLQQTLMEQMAQGSPKFRIYFQLAMQNPMMAAGIPKMIAEDPEAKQADKDAAKTLEAILAIGQARGGLSTIPNRTSRDQIEFMLWEKKAKELGIDYTAEHVGTLIQRELAGQYKGDVRIRQAMQQEFQGFNLTQCLEGLAAEFRVRAAQTALLGDPLPGFTAPTPGRTANIYDPPYELFEFFRDKTSPTTYEALAVPAANLMGEVQETPTDDELHRLFDARKGYEPDPSKEEPGFRDPRKIKVEWVSATGEEPYYRKAAAEWTTRAEQYGKSHLWGLVVPVPGMGTGAWAAFIAGPSTVKEPLVFHEYERRYAEGHQFAVRNRWGGISTFVLPQDLLDTSLIRPQTVAAAVGGGAGLAVANSLTAPGLFYSAAVAGEQKARAKSGIPYILGGVPTPGLLATTMGGVAKYIAAEPAPLPVEAYKAELLKSIIEHKARELAIADLKKLQENVAKLSDAGKAKDKSAARDAIAEFVKSRGLQTGATADFVSEWSIADDPAMAPLKALKDKGADGNDPHAALGNAPSINFGQQFFWTTNPRQNTRQAATGTYTPEFYPDRTPQATGSPLSKPEPIFLAWRTDDRAGKAVPFNEAKPRVIEAWKRVHARKRAQDEAEKLANELRNRPGGSEFTVRPDMLDLQEKLRQRSTDPKARDRVKLFTIADVAPYQIVPDLSGRSFGPVARPFLITPSANIPYPTADMTARLLAERTNPPRTTFVLPDQPKDTYYVFAVVNRHVQTEEDYRRFMLPNPSAPGGVREAIRGAYTVDEAKKAHDSVIGLLKAEFKYTETDEQKKRIDERDKRGSDE